MLENLKILHLDISDPEIKDTIHRAPHLKNIEFDRDHGIPLEQSILIHNNMAIEHIVREICVLYSHFLRVLDQ
jgi:hypothetical protein